MRNIFHLKSQYPIILSQHQKEFFTNRIRISNNSLNKTSACEKLTSVTEHYYITTTYLEVDICTGWACEAMRHSQVHTFAQNCKACRFVQKTTIVKLTKTIKSPTSARLWLVTSTFETIKQTLK